MKYWLPPTLGALFLWGLWSFIPKIVTKYISPKSALFFEILGAMIIGGYVFASLKFKPEIHPMGILLAIITGIIGSIGVLFFLDAVSKGPVSLITVLSSLYPIITVILAVIFLNEPLSLKQILGIMLGLGAIVLITS